MREAGNREKEEERERDGVEGRARGKGETRSQRVAKEDGGNRAGQREGDEVRRMEGWTEGAEGER